jgi:hypothetical protein
MVSDWEPMGTPREYCLNDWVDYLDGEIWRPAQIKDYRPILGNVPEVEGAAVLWEYTVRVPHSTGAKHLERTTITVKSHLRRPRAPDHLLEIAQPDPALEPTPPGYGAWGDAPPEPDGMILKEGEAPPDVQQIYQELRPLIADPSGLMLHPHQADALKYAMGSKMLSRKGVVKVGTF